MPRSSIPRKNLAYIRLSLRAAEVQSVTGPGAKKVLSIVPTRFTQAETPAACAASHSPAASRVERPSNLAKTPGSQMARSVMELLEDINQQGTTIIMVTHDPELAARAQRNVHIVDGMATDLSLEPGLARAPASGADTATSHLA